MTVPTGVAAATRTTTVTVPLEPAGAAGALQFMVPPLPTGGVVQVVPVGYEIDWNVVFAGMLSLKVALVAVPLPTFVAVCV